MVEWLVLSYIPILPPTSQQRETAIVVADSFDSVVNVILGLAVLTLGVLLW
jgi:hypothetical protein